MGEALIQNAGARREGMHIRVLRRVYSRILFTNTDGWPHIVFRLE